MRILKLGKGLQDFLVWNVFWILAKVLFYVKYCSVNYGTRPRLGGFSAMIVWVVCTNSQTPWRAVSEICSFGERIHWFRVNGLVSWRDKIQWFFLSRLHKFANPLGPIRKTPWRIVKEMRFRWTDSLVLWRRARGVGWQNTVICLKLSTQALISFWSGMRMGEVCSYGGGCRLRCASDAVCSKLPNWNLFGACM